jgi:hypothetical protein
MTSGERDSLEFGQERNDGRGLTRSLRHCLAIFDTLGPILFVTRNDSRD